MPRLEVGAAEAPQDGSLMRRIINNSASVSGVLSATAIVIMTVGIALDVVVRAVNGQGITGVIELADPLLVCVAFFGLSVTEMKGEHVALTLVVDRIRPRVRYALVALGVLLCMLFTIWLIAAGAEEAVASVASGEVRAGVVRIPLSPARIAVVIGAAILLLQFALTFYDAVRSSRANAPVGIWAKRESTEDE